MATAANNTGHVNRDRTPVDDDRDNLENWCEQTAEEEHQDGYRDGWHDVGERVTRDELATLMASLKFGRATFFGQLRSMDMLRDEPAANGSFSEFERLMFGPYGNGLGGDYAKGYIRAFETFWTFVRSVH